MTTSYGNVISLRSSRASTRATPQRRSSWVFPAKRSFMSLLMPAVKVTVEPMGDHCDDLLTWKSDIDPEIIGANRPVHFVVRHDVDRFESDNTGQSLCAMDDDLQSR